MRRWLWIGGFALAGLWVAWFLATHDRVPAKQWVGPSGEARLRPFLAAQRFAERMGLRVKELRSLPELDALPPAGAVLLLPARRQALDGNRLGQLVGWVERGGHLILEAEPLRLQDPLLDRLGLGREAHAAPKPVAVALGDGRTLKAALPGPLLRGAVRNPRVKAGDKDGWTLVSFERGKGLVTAAGNLEFARNGSIGKNDHAELLWHVLQLSPAAELRVFARPQRLSLWRFLRENAAPVLLAAGALLALWLWRISPRFGPLAPDAPVARRRLLDHLRASGRYFWARGLRERLVIAARDAALRRLARAQPDFAVASPAERAARLARLAGVEEQEAARFIAAGGAMRGAGFIRIVQIAQRVHSALEKGKT